MHNDGPDVQSFILQRWFPLKVQPLPFNGCIRQSEEDLRMMMMMMMLTLLLEAVSAHRLRTASVKHGDNPVSSTSSSEIKK